VCGPSSSPNRSLIRSKRLRLVSVSGELVGSAKVDRRGGLFTELEGSDLALVVSLSLGLPLLLQLVDDVLVTPTDLVRQPLQGTVLPAGLESEDSESGGDDHLLDLVLGGGDTLKERESGQGGGTSGRLVGNHSSDGLVEDPRGSSEMERTGLPGVDQMLLVQVSVVSELVPEERTRNVDLLTSNNSNLLTAQDLLGNDRSETTEQVTFAVDDDGGSGERHLWGGRSGLGDGWLRF